MSVDKDIIRLWGVPLIISKEEASDVGKYKKNYYLFGKIKIFSKGVFCSSEKKKEKNLFFSISTYDVTHIKIIFLGIKLTIPKIGYYKLKKQNPFYKYQQRNEDITKIPSATGHLREIQLANVALLKELDYVCKQNDLSYWLDGGTMLGAVRHGGFIPWDDDIDVGMLIDDYEKVIAAFEKSSRDKDIYACYVCDNKKPDLFIIKVKHKKCPSLFVDIFPFYVYGKSLCEAEQLKKTKEIRNIRKKELSKIDFTAAVDVIKDKYNEIMESQILSSAIPQNLEETDLVWGIQYNHQWKNWFTNYNVIFPLKPQVFEGCEFWGINNPDAFLSRVYGNYMSYPKRISFGHSTYKKKKKTELKIIKMYAQNFNKGK